MELSLFAPAKLNLYLSVVGRRPDGYHLLETLMVKIDLADRLVLRPGGDRIRLEVLGADLPSGPGNLVYRAAEAFFLAAGLEPGLDVSLEKKIPTAAGLGGGSSDAAATLLGLNSIFGRPLSSEQLADLGLGLGADVPFFLGSWSAAWARGIGEKLSPAGFRKGDRYLLVNPGWSLSTAWVFKNFKLKLTSRQRNHIFSTLNESSFTIGRDLKNDLEKVVLPRYPELSRIKELLLEAGAVGSLMTGSGPTVFGVYDDPDRRDEALTRLQKDGSPSWKVMSTDPVRDSVE